MKKGIALLATLAILVLISVIVSLSVERSNEFAKKDYAKYIIQHNTLLKNFIDTFGQFAKDINGSEALFELTLIPIILTDEKTNLTFSAKIGSNSNLLNINWLVKKLDNNESNTSTQNPFNKKEFEINSDFYTILEKILKDYDVDNITLFMNLLLDTLDNNLFELEYRSELALYERNFLNGEIKGFNQFSKIIDSYILITGDLNINRVPWDKLISFSNKKLDFNFITPELLKYLVTDLSSVELFELTNEKLMSYDEESIKEYLSEEQIEFLKKFNVSFFEPTIKIEFEYSINDLNGDAILEYGLKDKKVTILETRFQL